MSRFQESFSETVLNEMYTEFLPLIIHGNCCDLYYLFVYIILKTLIQCLFCLHRQEFPVDGKGDTPLSMSQYYNLLSWCRIPKKNIDVYVAKLKPGEYYRLSVFFQSILMERRRSILLQEVGLLKRTFRK